VLVIVAPVLYGLLHRQTASLSLRSGNSLRTDTLSDGTVVSLNRNTELTAVNYAAKEGRSVELQGEAFFTVAPDKDGLLSSIATEGLSGCWVRPLI